MCNFNEWPSPGGRYDVDAGLDPFLTVFYTGHPDEVMEFPRDGDTVYFGSDPDGCDLVIDEEQSRRLSMVAGKIWRQWGQLWIVNLSESHDLFLQVVGLPPEEPLALRTPGLPLHARTIPGTRCRVSGPSGDWALVVDQRMHDVHADVPGFGGSTLRAPAVPSDLHDVAAALCEPLLCHGARLPASYAQIASRLGITVKAGRVRVERLVQLYEEENPILRRHREERERRVEAALAGPEWRRGPGGVWHHRTRSCAEGNDPRKPRVRPPPESTTPAQEPDRTPALPHAYDVACLLVRRRMITVEDLEKLHGSPPDRSASA